MSLALPLSEEHRDCLQEITNVAMGGAAESLAEFTHLFVCLPIPVIRYVNADNLVSAFDHIEGHKLASIVTQHCGIGELECRALFIINDDSMEDLAQSTGSSETTELDATKLLEDLYETVSVTCFDRLGEMFGSDIMRQPMVIQDKHVTPDSVDFSVITEGQSLVAVEINYHIESHPFSCNLLLLFPQSALDSLTQSLDKLLN